MQTFKRIHDSGTETLLSQYPDGGWRIQINLREVNHTPVTITGYLAPTLTVAQELADYQILKHGHVCNGSCREWVEFLSAEPSL
jgi:hypothetical protein